MSTLTLDSPTITSVPQAESIIGRIAEKSGVSETDARRRLEETLKFLDVAARAEQPVSPSKVIDEAWHCFLVHTRAYQTYCAEQFGRFIHHQPTLSDGKSDTAEAYRRARAMAERQFGSLDASIWPPLGAGAGCKEGACTGECNADCHGDCTD